MFKLNPMAGWSPPRAVLTALLALAATGLLAGSAQAVEGLRWDVGAQTFRYENTYSRTMKLPGQAEQSAEVRVRADLTLRSSRPGQGRLTLVSLELGDGKGRWTTVERIPGSVAQVAVRFDGAGRVTLVESLVAYHHERRYWLARAPAAPLAMPLLPQNVTKIVANVAASVHPRTGRVVSADSGIGRKNVRSVKVPVTAPMVELLPREILQAFIVPTGALAGGGSATASSEMLEFSFETKQAVGTSTRFGVQGDGVTAEPAEGDHRSLPGGVRTHLEGRGALDAGKRRLDLLAGALDVAVPIGEAGVVTSHSAFSFTRR